MNLTRELLFELGQTRLAGGRAEFGQLTYAGQLQDNPQDLDNLLAPGQLPGLTEQGGTAPTSPRLSALIVKVTVVGSVT